MTAPPEPAADAPAPTNRPERTVPLTALLLAALFVTAAALRVAHWAADRDFWMDELFVARNVVARDFTGLTLRLSYEAFAPVTFLWALKLSAVAAGAASEQALRFFPLLVGTAAVPMTAALAWVTTRRAAATVAVTALVGFNPYAVIYSGELKPYGGDAFWAAAIVTLAVATHRALARGEPVARSAPYWGLFAVGGLTVWSSLAGLFVLATAGAGLGLAAIARRSQPWTAALAVTGLVWAVQIATMTARLAPAGPTADYYDAYWTNAGGLPPTDASVADRLAWLGPTAAHVFAELVPTGPRVAAAIAAVVGVVLLRKERFAGLVTLAVVTAALAVGLFRIYPLAPRLSLFVLPVLALWAACGVDAAVSLARDRRLAAVAILGLVALYPPFVGRGYRWDRHRCQSRACLDHIAEHLAPGDRLVVTHADSTRSCSTATSGCTTPTASPASPANRASSPSSISWGTSKTNAPSGSSATTTRSPNGSGRTATNSARRGSCRNRGPSASTARGATGPSDRPRPAARPAPPERPARRAGAGRARRRNRPRRRPPRRGTPRRRGPRGSPRPPRRHG